MPYTVYYNVVVQRGIDHLLHCAKNYKVVKLFGRETCGNELPDDFARNTHSTRRSILCIISPTPGVLSSFLEGTIRTILLPRWQ